MYLLQNIKFRPPSIDNIFLSVAKISYLFHAGNTSMCFVQNYRLPKEKFRMMFLAQWKAISRLRGSFSVSMDCMNP